MFNTFFLFHLLQKTSKCIFYNFLKEIWRNWTLHFHQNMYFSLVCSHNFTNFNGNKKLPFVKHLFEFELHSGEMYSIEHYALKLVVTPYEIIGNPLLILTFLLNTRRTIRPSYNSLPQYPISLIIILRKDEILSSTSRLNAIRTRTDVWQTVVLILCLYSICTMFYVIVFLVDLNFKISFSIGKIPAILNVPYHKNSAKIYRVPGE
jgi:hypothetical protein